MRGNRFLTMGTVVSALALLVASAYARSADPARPGVAADLGRLRAGLAGPRYLESAEAWARKDTAAAGRLLAAAARDVRDAVSSAGRAAEIGAARGFEAAESFGEKLANKTTSGTEQAWSTATDAVRRGMGKLGQVVGRG